MIEIINATKRFKNLTAVDGVSLTVGEGKIFTFLGENGAGKSTLINMICGLTSLSGGEIKVLGEKVFKGAKTVQKNIGIVPQSSSVCPNLSVYRNLKFICEIYGFDKELSERKIQNVIEELKLTEYKNVAAKKLSGGCAKRLSIAMTIITEPKVLVLDEPTANLDVRARRDLWEVIKGLKSNGATVLYTTHYMDEAEALSDDIAVMSHGKLKFCGSIDEIKKLTGKSTLEEAYLKITEGV